MLICWLNGIIYLLEYFAEICAEASVVADCFFAWNICCSWHLDHGRSCVSFFEAPKKQLFPVKYCPRLKENFDPSINLGHSIDVSHMDNTPIINVLVKCSSLLQHTDTVLNISPTKHIYTTT